MKKTLVCCLVFTIAVVTSSTVVDAEKKKKNKSKAAENPYAEYVWPPPPDDARIRLVDILSERKDVEAESKFKKMLVGQSPKNQFDELVKPYGVAIDSLGRIIVSDTGSGALVRFDKTELRYDVLGTAGRIRLAAPLGITVGADDVIYVADSGLGWVVALDSEGALVATYGGAGELTNPTDAELSPDGSQLYVADSKSHQIVVFDVANGGRVGAFGRRGNRDGEFNFPTSLAFDPEGNLYVVDQANSRVQIVTPDGEYLDQFGGLGVGFGNFVRPKGIAIDEFGLIYVTDAAFNNVQLFDVDLSLLTWVGSGGRGPGQFNVATGIAVRDDQFAIVDQLNARVQLFSYLEKRAGE